MLYRLCYALVIAVAFSYHLSLSQVHAPKREVRAVWITTVMGLDWPQSLEPSEQQRTLREMVQKLHMAHFNTIFFQVRGRADAMYRSQYEPWAQQLTGTLGKDPSWDPLAFIINEAHERGMEVHAWFNTFLIKSGAPKPPDSTPRHLIYEHPDWLHLVENEWWMDPGLPQTRKYTIKVAMEIVRNYDVDGMHFDFMRYPGKSFPDDATYRDFGGTMNRQDWRRENINKFVRAFYDSAVTVKPMLKIGSAPIGIYNGDTKQIGTRSYDDLFQDSRRWLQEGKQDYLAPQVYWSFGQKPGNPDFAALAKDWSQNVSGRHVYIGVAAYKPDVFREMPMLIDSTRLFGAQGNVFFRYEHINKMLNVGKRYQYLSVIPPMRWKDSVPPNPPLNFQVKNNTDGIFTIEWNGSAIASDSDWAKYYNLYRSATRPVDIENAQNLVATISASLSHYVDTIMRPTSGKYFYALTALDKGYNESSPVEEGVILPEMLQLSQRFSYQFKLASTFPEPASDDIFFSYEIKDYSSVSLVVRDSAYSQVVYVVDAVQPPGRYIASADVSQFKRGKYVYELISGNLSLQREFSILH